MKTKIEVDINNIKVEKGYFSFDYIVIINDKVIEENTYDNSHSWDDKKAFKKLLKDGYAVSLAIQWVLEVKNK